MKANSIEEVLHIIGETFLSTKKICNSDIEIMCSATIYRGKLLLTQIEHKENKIMVKGWRTKGKRVYQTTINTI